MTFISWRTSLWLLLSTVVIPAVLAISVGILILVFYRESWDLAFGVLVLCFAVFAVTGSSITIALLRRTGRLAQMQAEFIANITHEFRTPLTAIRLFVETLRSRRAIDPRDQQRCLELLAEETTRMQRLVDRVLTFRQLDRSRTTLDLTPHQPEALVRRALAPFTEVAGPAAERLELVFEPDLPRILASPETLDEALRNLVQNALKYSAGAVVVNLRHDGQGIAFSVRDSGPAIPRRERKRIFKRFYRLPGDQPGSGLGLAIAHAAVKAHGGTLELRSAPGQGNVFILRLPLVEARPQEDDLAENGRAGRTAATTGAAPHPGTSDGTAATTGAATHRGTPDGDPPPGRGKE